MQLINIYEAKTQLSKLVKRVMEGGEEIIIAIAGKSAARLVPLKPVKNYRFGRLKGKVKIAPDFDAPLPEEILADFEGR